MSDILSGIYGYLNTNPVFEKFSDLYGELMHVTPVETGVNVLDVYAVRTGTVNFWLYRNGTSYLCFDCGFGVDRIQRQLDCLGIDAKNVTHIFLTHSDFDHVGGISVFSNAEIFLSSDEEQMFSGKNGRAFGLIHNAAISRPYHLLHGDDVIQIGAATVRAVATPGHTPGSMCYLLNESMLFVGDTFRLRNDRIIPLRRYINMDTHMQKISIRKLALLPASLAFTGHFGYTNDFQTAIREWK